MDESISGISNGCWLLGIDDKYDIYDVALAPGRKISLLNNGNGFICDADDVTVLGKIMLTLDFNF